MDCKNFEGSEELRVIIQGDNSCDRNNIQQAANVALNGAIGSSGYRFSPVRRKRPPEDPHYQRLSVEGSMTQMQFSEVVITFLGWLFRLVQCAFTLLVILIFLYFNFKISGLKLFLCCRLTILMLPKLLHLVDLKVPLAISSVNLNWSIGKSRKCTVLFGPMDERI
jgi:hypothetical protein